MDSAHPDDPLPRDNGFDATSLFDLLLEWQSQVDRGEKASLPEALRDRPELLARLLAELQNVKSLQHWLDTSNRHDRRTDDSPTPPLQLPVGLGNYEVHEKLGRGGMGEVFKAWQTNLKRWVALKLIRVERDDEQGRQRFQAEAHAAARLTHPNIVQIHAVEQQEDTPFLVLEYCPNGSLSRHLQGKVLAPLQAAWLIEVLARAMEYAHQQGVVHRDLKPGNVLLSAANATQGQQPVLDGLVPKIGDFGLARLEDEEHALTRTGAIHGTPTYMAPEQAKGLTKNIGPACDIWALGVMLYEFLTGRPPFQGATSLETLKQVTESEPVPPRRLQPNLPAPLETICLKCLQKAPEKRYASAGALADDLQRFRAGQPIHARPASARERLVAWARRRPGRAAAVGMGLVLLLTVLIGSIFYIARLNDLLEVEGKRRKIADDLLAAQKNEREAREESATQKYLAGLNRIQKLASRPLPGWRDEALKELGKIGKLATPVRDETELRSTLANCLGADDVMKPRFLANERFRQLRALAYEPSGKRLAVAENWRADGKDLNVFVLRTEDGSIENDFALPPDNDWAPKSGFADGISCLRFSPDGKTLFATTRSGMLHCLNPDLPKRAPHTLFGLGVRPQLSITPDGKTIFALGENSLLHRLELHDKWIRKQSHPEFPCNNYLALLPALGKLACVHDRKLWLTDERLQNRRKILDDVEWLLAMPDGRSVICVFDKEVKLADLLDGKVVVNFREPGQEHAGHPIGPARFAISPDGALLATASQGEAPRMHLWEVARGRLLAKISVPGGLQDLAFSPDGKTLAITNDKKILFLDLARSREQTLCALQPRQIDAFHLFEERPFLSTMAIGDRDRWSLWDALVKSPFPLCELPANSQFEGFLMVPSDLAHLALLRSEHELWRSDGFVVQKSGLGKDRTNEARLDPQGRLWLMQQENLVVCKKGRPGEKEFSWRNLPPPDRAAENNLRAFVLNQDRVLVGCRSGHVAFLQSDNLKQLGYWDRGRTPIDGVALSSDNTLGAAGNSDGVLTLLSLPTGEVKFEKKIHDANIHQLAFLTDQLLFTGSMDGTIKLHKIDGSNLSELFTLTLPMPIRQMTLSKDKSRLFVLLQNERAVRVWHLDRLDQAFDRFGLGLGLPKAAPAAPRIAGPGGFLREVFPANAREKPLHSQVMLPMEHPGELPDKLPNATTHRWSGWLQPLRPGKHQLLIQARGGVRLWWQHETRIDEWAVSECEKTLDLDLSPFRQPLRIEVTGIGFTPTLKLFWKRYDEEHCRPLTEFEVSPTPDADPIPAHAPPVEYAKAIERETWRSWLGGWTLEEAPHKLKAFTVPWGHPCRRFLYEAGNREALGWLQVVEEVNLQAPNEWQMKDLEFLTRMPRLKSLQVAHTFNDAHMPIVHRLPGLKHLNLEGSEVTNVGIAILNGHAGLESLYLPRSLVPSGLERLKDVKTVTALHFNGPHITDDIIPVINRNFPQLEKLHVAHASVSSKGLAQLTRLGHLKAFTPSLNQPADSVVDLLAAHCPKLNSLSLFNSELSFASMRKIATFETMEYLGLTQCKGVTAESLAGFVKMTKLKVLQLPSWTDDASLLAISKCQALESIYICPDNGRTAVTQAGCRHLAKMESLESIVMERQRLIGQDPAAVRILLDLPRLKTLHISPPPAADFPAQAGRLLTPLLDTLTTRQEKLDFRVPR